MTNTTNIQCEARVLDGGEYVQCRHLDARIVDGVTALCAEHLHLADR